MFLLYLPFIHFYFFLLLLKPVKGIPTLSCPSNDLCGWHPKLKGKKENLPEKLSAQKHKGCAIKISLLPFTCLPCRLFMHACRPIHRNNSLPLKNAYPLNTG